MAFARARLDRTAISPSRHEVGYNCRHVRFSTHSIKGLSENDFIGAAKVGALLGA